MDRRQFIREVFLWSAGASLAIPQFNILPEALAAEKQSSLLSLAKGEDYVALVAQVLTPLGGMAQFVRPGDRVVVKPNIGWDRNPEQGGHYQSIGSKGCRRPGPGSRRQKSAGF